MFLERDFIINCYITTNFKADKGLSRHFRIDRNFVTDFKSEQISAKDMRTYLCFNRLQSR